VVIDSAGQLGTTSSSARFKHDIKPMEQSSEAILRLRPVTFHYNEDASETAQFGLIAEQVAEVDPNLIVRDEEGNIYTVRYDAVNAMLLNEFLKEHRKLQEQSRKMEQQEALAAKQQQRIENLAVALKEQASLIQKVRARLEVRKNREKSQTNSCLSAK
jgi:hypothetical protein